MRQGEKRQRLHVTGDMGHRALQRHALTAEQTLLDGRILSGNLADLEQRLEVLRLLCYVVSVGVGAFYVRSHLLARRAFMATAPTGPGSAVHLHLVIDPLVACDVELFRSTQSGKVHAYDLRS